MKILIKCCELAAAAGLKIINIDSTPIGEALGISPERVGIKAITNETMASWAWAV